MPESHWRREEATGLPTQRRGEGKAICNSWMGLGVPNQPEICTETNCELAHISINVTAVTALDLTLSFGVRYVPLVSERESDGAHNWCRFQNFGPDRQLAILLAHAYNLHRIRQH